MARKVIKIFVDCADDLPDALLAGYCQGMFEIGTLPGAKIVKVKIGGVVYELGKEPVSDE